MTQSTSLERPVGEQSLSQQAPLQPRDSQEIDMLQVLLVLAREKRLIAKCTLAAAVIALAIAFVIPNKYSARAVIMPPQQSQSAVTALMGQFGALAGMSGKADLGLKNPSDLWVAILRSESIADSLIERFQLKGVYGKRYLQDTRKKLADRTDIAAAKEGLITIQVEDRDAKRAAEMANAYLEELHRLNSRLVVTEAGQRRLFFEKQLESTRDELAQAEVALKQLQERTGLIHMDAQARAIIEGVATLKAQIAAKEVQLHAMRSFATERNPDLRLLQDELEGLRAQLSIAEHKAGAGNGDLQVATQKVPEAALEYIRHYRKVKYNETIFELLAKQFEAAKLDEARSAAVIQVVDRATVPEKKSSPIRSLIGAIAAAAAALLSSIYVLVKDSLSTMSADPARQGTLEALKANLSRF